MKSWLSKFSCFGSKNKKGYRMKNPKLDIIKVTTSVNVSKDKGYEQVFRANDSKIMASRASNNEDLLKTKTNYQDKIVRDIKAVTNKSNNNEHNPKSTNNHQGSRGKDTKGVATGINNCNNNPKSTNSHQGNRVKDQNVKAYKVNNIEVISKPKSYNQDNRPKYSIVDNNNKTNCYNNSLKSMNNLPNNSTNHSMVKNNRANYIVNDSKLAADQPKFRDDLIKRLIIRPEYCQTHYEKKSKDISSDKQLPSKQSRKRNFRDHDTETEGKSCNRSSSNSGGIRKNTTGEPLLKESSSSSTIDDVDDFEGAISSDNHMERPNRISNYHRPPSYAKMPMTINTIHLSVENTNFCPVTQSKDIKVNIPTSRIKQQYNKGKDAKVVADSTIYKEDLTTSLIMRYEQHEDDGCLSRYETKSEDLSSDMQFTSKKGRQRIYRDQYTETEGKSCPSSSMLDCSKKDIRNQCVKLSIYGGNRCSTNSDGIFINKTGELLLKESSSSMTINIVDDFDGALSSLDHTVIGKRRSGYQHPTRCGKRLKLINGPYMFMENTKYEQENEGTICNRNVFIPNNNCNDGTTLDANVVESAPKTAILKNNNERDLKNDRYCSDITFIQHCMIDYNSERKDILINEDYVASQSWASISEDQKSMEVTKQDDKDEYSSPMKQDIVNEISEFIHRISDYSVNNLKNMKFPFEDNIPVDMNNVCHDYPVDTYKNNKCSIIVHNNILDYAPGDTYDFNDCEQDNIVINHNGNHKYNIKDEYYYNGSTFSEKEGNIDCVSDSKVDKISGEVSPSTLTNEKQMSVDLSEEDNTDDDTDDDTNTSGSSEIIVIPVPLKNPRGYCFLNSVIQVLRCCLKFNNEIIKYHNSDEIVLYDGSSKDQQFVNHFCKLFHDMMHVKELGDKYYKSLDNVQQYFKEFSEGDDVQKCFMTLLTIFNNVTKKTGQYNSINKNKEQDTFDKYRSKNEGFVFDLFYGQMRHSMICKDCNYDKHQSFQLFKTLPLPVPIKEYGVTLLDCIKCFLEPSEIVLEEKMDCRCMDGSMNFVSKSEITHAPKYLFIYLTRGSYYQKGLKNATVISFGLTLVLPMINNTEMEYKLISVIDHVGDNENGHYYCCCNCEGKNWWRISDSWVEELGSDFRKIQSENAIAFIFKKR